jgi:hypothetical protein
VTTTVVSSTASTLSIPAKSGFCALVLSSARARSSEKTTSSAVMALPSWKVTPSRRLKV